MTNEPEVTEHESEKPRARKRGGRHRAKEQAASPAPQPTPAPTPAPRQPAASPQVKRVVLRNRRGQLLTPSVLSEDGAQETLKLPAYGRGEVFEDRITDYTRDLGAQGHLSIDPPR